MSRETKFSGANGDRKNIFDSQPYPVYAYSATRKIGFSPI